MKTHSRFNPGIVVTSMGPSMREILHVKKVAQKLSGKLSLKQVKAIRAARAEAPKKIQKETA